jgi:hypothetical protein
LPPLRERERETKSLEKTTRFEGVAVSWMLGLSLPEPVPRDCLGCRYYRRSANVCVAPRYVICAIKMKLEEEELKEEMDEMERNEEESLDDDSIW